MQFKWVFVAIVLGTALVVAAVTLHHARPERQLQQPTEQLVKATGKCATCHQRETGAIVHQFEKSAHAEEGINCLDCHRPRQGQQEEAHKGFTIAKRVTSLNCKQCHKTQHDQYMRSRHAAPAWAAVVGSEPFTKEQVAFAEKHHPGAVDRPPNKLAQLEGPAAATKGCKVCHGIGAPNPDGSIGTCTQCHARHQTSIELARQPETCGQCHMGPDHAQLEIYNESKHGVIFQLQKDQMNLGADPKELTTEDMSVPTCATCHMSGLEGMKVTHDVGERLSWKLFSPVSEKRPHYQMAQEQMQEICLKCHTEPHVKQFYTEAEQVVHATNEKVQRTKKIVDKLRADGLLTDQPFDEPIEFAYFDFWHYYGRTAKHGAFMGGADFVQWHGNYELLLKHIEIEHKAEEIRAKAAGRAEGGKPAAGAATPSGGDSDQGSGGDGAGSSG